MTNDSEQRQLQAGLAALGLEAAPEMTAQWLTYLGLLRQWSNSYNLVAPGDLEALLPRHLLDALSIHHLLGTGAVLDVGSGAGFPGLALAIARPHQAFWLLDSNGKKARFLRHVVRQLGLGNVQVLHQRVERYSAEAGFSTITSRAFSSLAAFAQAVRHLAGPDTRLLAMKGRMPEQELAELPAWVTVEAVHAIEVPGLAAARHVIQMTLDPASDNPGSERPGNVNESKPGNES